MQEQSLPFTFELQQQEDEPQMKIFNTKEVLEISELHLQDDTLVIPMHIFDTEIRTVVESGRMNGVRIKNYADASLPAPTTTASRNETSFNH